MKNITPKREREAWRGKVITAKPWDYIVRVWADWANEIPKREPFYQFVRTLATSPASSVLFGGFMTHGDGICIVISDSPDFRTTDGTLWIRFYVPAGTFEFQHRTFSGHDDHKVCLASEAVETLRLFLRYKYGVLLEGPVA